MARSRLCGVVCPSQGAVSIDTAPCSSWRLTGYELQFLQHLLVQASNHRGNLKFRCTSGTIWGVVCRCCRHPAVARLVQCGGQCVQQATLVPSQGMLRTGSHEPRLLYVLHRPGPAQCAGAQPTAAPSMLLAAPGGVVLHAAHVVHSRWTGACVCAAGSAMVSTCNAAVQLAEVAGVYCDADACR